MPQQIIQISPRWIDWLTIVGFALTIAGLYIAYRQIRDSRKTLRETSELILRETQLLYDSAKIFTNVEFLPGSERDKLLQRWTGLLDCAKAMYQNDQEWNRLIENLQGEHHGGAETS
jgi:hypothetical protein